jgi:hypothetical protein
LKTKKQGNRKVQILYIVWIFSYSGGRSKQRPYHTSFFPRGAACCALRREDINVLFGSLDYDFVVALKPKKLGVQIALPAEN